MGRIFITCLLAAPFVSPFVAPFVSPLYGQTSEPRAAGDAADRKTHAAEAAPASDLALNPEEHSEKPTDYRRTIPGTEIEFEMVGVPGGSYAMGSPSQGTNESRKIPPDETPRIRVTVSPFWIGRHEVTWGEYRVFMDLCRWFEMIEDANLRPISDENQSMVVTAPSKLYDPSFTFETGDDPRQPAVSISQYAAKQYTKWLSLLTGEFYRLPSEAEWEYACRAGSSASYSFGDDPDRLDAYAWFTDNSDYATAKVGTKQPNAWGIYDMHGNVAEWVLDQYDAAQYPKWARGGASIESNPIAWPTKRYPRVLRGGSWDSDAEECRSAARGQSNDDELRAYDPNVPKSPWWFASEAGQTIGFRIVRPVRLPSLKDRERYWRADVESIQRDVDRRIDDEGRGERGFVDPELPDVIEQLRNRERETE